MSYPDFMIIGAMKCGTSTLAAQLACQQNVFMTTPKEPNFFSDDDVYALGADWYAHLYAEAKPGDMTGEASTHYTKLPTYPQTIARMQATLPTPPRLIYMIRNPLERAVSHYIHEWTEARMGADPLVEFARHSEMCDYGRYAMQISPFVEAFGVERIHLTSLEQIKSDPDGEFLKIGAFLGLPKGYAWQHDLGAQNVSSERARRIPFQNLLIDNPVAKTLRQVLVPKSLRTAIRNKLTMQDRPTLPDHLKTELQASFLEDRAALGKLFPDHPALTLCYPFATDG